MVPNKLHTFRSLLALRDETWIFFFYVCIECCHSSNFTISRYSVLPSTRDDESI